MSRTLRIVLIEDDADDVELLQDALDSHNIQYELTLLKDGSAAAGYCEKADTLPDIIVMDFNLPKIHGRDVVKLIRCREKFANVPILILSTSSSQEDIKYAYKTGADKYLIKPATIEAIRETIRTIVELANARVMSN
jgi:DNA-binding response OmpR family regulator